VSRFAGAAKLSFGRPRTDEKRSGAVIVSRAAARRAAMLAAAADALAVLPGEGQSVHCVMTGRYDLMHVVSLLLAARPADHARLATLSYNGRNLDEMLAIADAGHARTLTLLCSAFFRDHNKALFAETLAAFRARGWRCAAARSHAKIVCVSHTDGTATIMEGSANLRTNGNREQLTLFADRTLHDFHAGWIDALVSRHEGENDADGSQAPEV
jgi:hypothetical protein